MLKSTSQHRGMSHVLDVYQVLQHWCTHELQGTRGTYCAGKSLTIAIYVPCSRFVEHRTPSQDSVSANIYHVCGHGGCHNSLDIAPDEAAIPTVVPAEAGEMAKR